MEQAEKVCKKLSAKQKKLIQELTVTDENASPVISKIHGIGKVFPNPLYGKYEADINGTHCIVEYEPDTNLRDTEQVPLLEEGGIETFFRREVLPYVSDAWIDEEKTQTGYEISFTRYFYKPAPMRTLAEIKTDILEMEQETEGLLGEIIGSVKGEG